MGVVDGEGVYDHNAKGIQAPNRESEEKSGVLPEKM